MTTRHQLKGLLIALISGLLIPSLSAGIQFDRETGQGFISNGDFIELQTAANLHGAQLEELEFFAGLTFDYQLALVHEERAEIKLVTAPIPRFFSDLVETEIEADKVVLTGFAGALFQPGVIPGPAGQRTDATGMEDPEGEFIISKVTPLESGKTTLSAFLGSEQVWSVVIEIPGPVDEALDLAKKIPLKLRGEGLLGLTIPSEEHGPLIVDSSWVTQGAGTHLGRWTSVGLGQFVFESGILVAESSSAIFTAANRDELGADLSEQFGGFIDLETGMVLAVYELTGGTGRFQNVEGWAILRGRRMEDGGFVMLLEGGFSQPQKRR
jgi:hypothetical protein